MSSDTGWIKIDPAIYKHMSTPTPPTPAPEPTEATDLDAAQEILQVVSECHADDRSARKPVASIIAAHVAAATSPLKERIAELEAVLTSTARGVSLAQEETEHLRRVLKTANKHEAEARADLDAAKARIAELERQVADESAIARIYESRLDRARRERDAAETELAELRKDREKLKTAQRIVAVCMKYFGNDRLREALAANGMLPGKIKAALFDAHEAYYCSLFAARAAESQTGKP